MVYLRAPRHEVEEAAVGDVPAALELQPAELRAVPGQQGESPVRQPRGASQSDGLHTRGSPQWLLPASTPDQPGEDGPDDLVHVQPLVRQEDGGPELWLPGESPEPPAGGGDSDQVEGGEVCEHLAEQEVGQAEEGGGTWRAGLLAGERALPVVAVLQCLVAEVQWAGGRRLLPGPPLAGPGRGLPRLAEGRARPAPVWRGPGAVRGGAADL